MNRINGFFLIDKKEGETSRSVDNFIQKKFHLRSVGHLGTLDPFASGLLIVMVNEGTKFSFLIDDRFKTYVATLKLFEARDTLDSDGKIIEKSSKKTFNLEKISAVLDSFLGKSLQEPPLYSALKVDGERAYKKARKGDEFTLNKREIYIHEIKLIEFNDDKLTFLVTCSKGTYVRSLGRDIAHKLGTIGHLCALRRVEIGDYVIERAKPKEDITLEDLLPLETVAKTYPDVNLDEKTYVKVKNGAPIQVDSKSPFLSFFYQNKFIAIYKLGNDGLYYCKRGIASENH